MVIYHSSTKVSYVSFFFHIRLSVCVATTDEHVYAPHTQTPKLRGFSDSFLSGICSPSVAVRNHFVLQSKVHMLFRKKI